MAVLDRVKSAWNAFRDQPAPFWTAPGNSSGLYNRPDQKTFRSFFNERSIITSIYTRMSIDVSDVDFRHVSFDEQNRYKADVESALNVALNLEPNLD